MIVVQRINIAKMAFAPQRNLNIKCNISVAHSIKIGIVAGYIFMLSNNFPSKSNTTLR